MKDPQSALRYARVILKSRWPAAELYFIKDPYYGTMYAGSFLTGQAKDLFLKNLDTEFSKPTRLP